MLSYTPCPLNSQFDSLLRSYAYVQTSHLYNEAPEEVRDANMPNTEGAIPLTLRVGNPIATYKLNEIENPHAYSDHVIPHMEKYCELDALLYSQWMRLSLYCDMFREIM